MPAGRLPAGLFHWLRVACTRRHGDNSERKAARSRPLSARPSRGLSTPSGRSGGQPTGLPPPPWSHGNVDLAGPTLGRATAAIDGSLAPRASAARAYQTQRMPPSEGVACPRAKAVNYLATLPRKP
jgi:hypothetical protein